MLYFYYGENSFMRQQAVRELLATAHGEVTNLWGDDCTVAELRDLLQATSLFSSTRTVVLRNASENTAVWTALFELAQAADGDELRLIISDQKPDKRSKTYKQLSKLAKSQEFKPFSARDSRALEEWSVRYAHARGIVLDTAASRELIYRLGYDQLRLAGEIDRLSSLGATITREHIEQHTPRTPSDNAFELFSSALKGDVAGVQRQLADVRVTGDPFMTLGLLGSQVYQYAACAAGDKSAAQVASDIGAHPYGVTQIAPYAKKRGTQRSRQIVAALLAADIAMKSSSQDPWLLIERALLQIAHTS
ncbi:DNA polymerase III subunit delta [Candidatus Saccharibacteria bacterium]|nr:DNA polymerase III subunit delta [Candidatus Saccharibacteria bacterium]